MTIKLLTPRGAIPINAIITLDAATEASLVGEKVASTDLTGGFVWTGPVDRSTTPADQAYARASAVSGAGNQARTEFPPERVVLAATGCVCGVPCALVRIRCITGAAVALVVYDNPAASAGTQLYSGSLSTGQEANISAPIRAINGIRAAFASGSFEFYVSQEA